MEDLAALQWRYDCLLDENIKLRQQIQKTRGKKKIELEEKLIAEGNIAIGLEEEINKIAEFEKYIIVRDFHLLKLK